MPSQSALSADEKSKVKSTLDNSTQKILTATAARIYFAHPRPNKWSYGGLQGALIFLRDNSKDAFMLRLVDLTGTRGVIWEHELDEAFEYHQDRAFFHSFAGDKCMVGFVFADEKDAKTLYKKVTNRKADNVQPSSSEKKSSKGGRTNKSMISGPIAGSFVHVLNELEGSGISREVINQDMDFIKDFIRDAQIMSSKLDNSPEVQMQELRRQDDCPSEAEDAIQRAVWIELGNAPLRLLNTSTGLLCDRAAQINAFKMSAEYKELLSITTKHSDLQMGRIKEMVAIYFRCVMLSHRWEEKEALLHDIQDQDVRELMGIGGIAKLQSFCKVARDAGYCWAWMDTCCIDKKSNTELQESVNSMFVWYRHSALTIVYLSDVLPSSQPDALARSVWNERGWTFQELLAPKVVIFYRRDWSLYLDDRSPNHKESPAIMKELEDATGIDAQTLVAFRPGMSGAREKLQWASKRVTTVQEDVAYSLFGIFGITLPVIYGEKKQNALGRLLQEIVARSGDISVLDWIGEPSEFNSCLPAHITSYATPPRTLSPLSEDHIHTQVSSLRQTVAADLALKFYDQLEQLRAPRFANCRLHLPCISFRVTEVRGWRGLAQETSITYKIKADGLHDQQITTEEALVQFSRAKPIQQTFLLIRPWDWHLLGVPDFAEQANFAGDTESVGDWTDPGSSMDDSDELPGDSPVEEEHSSRALQLMVRLGQPFDAFLLAQQCVGEYKRIASDYKIIAQVKDIASVDNMDVGTIDLQASGTITSLRVHNSLTVLSFLPWRLLLHFPALLVFRMEADIQMIINLIFKPVTFIEQFESHQRVEAPMQRLFAKATICVLVKCALEESSFG